MTRNAQNSTTDGHGFNNMAPFNNVPLFSPKSSNRKF